MGSQFQPGMILERTLHRRLEGSEQLLAEELLDRLSLVGYSVGPTQLSVSRIGDCYLLRVESSKNLSILSPVGNAQIVVCPDFPNVYDVSNRLFQQTIYAVLSSPLSFICCRPTLVTGVVGCPDRGLPRQTYCCVDVLRTCWGQEEYVNDETERFTGLRRR